MTLFLIGLVSSIATSLVKKLNTYLSGTVLQGDGSQILSTVVAFAGSIGYLYYYNAIDLSNKTAMVATFSAIYGTADLYYKFVVQKFFQSSNIISQTSTNG